MRERVRSEWRANRRWEALSLAGRTAALPGLTPSQRASSLIDAAKIRAVLGDSAGAARDLAAARELAPGDPEASFRLAMALRDRPDEALPLALVAAEAETYIPRKSAALRLAGDIALDLGDGAAAKRAYGRAAELDGRDLDALLGLTRADPSEADAYAERAAAAASVAPLWRRPEAYRFVARLWRERGNASRAAEAIARARALEPDDAGSAERARFKEKPAAPASPSDALELLRGGTAERNTRFLDAAADAPLWMQAAAYRVAAEVFLNLDDTRRAEQSLLRALELDTRSLRVKTMLLALLPPGDITEADRAELLRLRRESLEQPR